MTFSVTFSPPLTLVTISSTYKNQTTIKLLLTFTPTISHTPTTTFIAPNSKHFGTMAAQPSLTSLATLDHVGHGFFAGTVNVRVLHSWEARNPKKGNNLMGLELLLLDEQSSSIQGFIPAARIGRFESALKPPGIYSLTNFLVTNNRTTYKVSHHKYLIQFTDQTVVEELKEPSCIPTDKFRFRSHEEFEAHADANVDLYDALGKIVGVHDEESDLDSAKGRIGIHLHLENGPVVRVTFWTGVAKQFREARAKLPAEPQVLLATAINPRRLGGALYLNSTSATRFFFDNDVEPSSKYLTWVNENKTVGGAADLSAYAVTKLEVVSLTELHAFLTSESPQEMGEKEVKLDTYQGTLLYNAIRN